MSGISSALMVGAGVGFSVAAPIGPMGMLCVQRTLAAGLSTGIAIGLGAATVHLAYGGLALFGRTELGGLFRQAALLSLLGGIVLLWLSGRLLRRVLVMGQLGEQRESLLSAYCGAVGLGILNPVTPVLFATVLPALLDLQAGSPTLVAGGIFLGSLGWWFVLSGSVSALRGRLSSSALNLVNKALALLLAGLAVLMMARAGWALI